RGVEVAALLLALDLVAGDAAKDRARGRAAAAVADAVADHAADQRAQRRARDPVGVARLIAVLEPAFARIPALLLRAGGRVHRLRVDHARRVAPAVLVLRVEVGARIVVVVAVTIISGEGGRRDRTHDRRNGDHNGFHDNLRWDVLIGNGQRRAA